MRLRRFGAADGACPILIDAPFALHFSSIADMAPGQSLIETLLDAGFGPVWLTDWRSAHPGVAGYGLDAYLAELVLAHDEAGGPTTVIGLCQGGLTAALLAARFPERLTRLVLVGTPLDQRVGVSPLAALTRATSLAGMAGAIESRGGVVLGADLRRAWAGLNGPEDLVDANAELFPPGADLAERQAAFRRWDAAVVDLPGRLFLEITRLAFHDNALAEGEATVLGRGVSLADIRCPTLLVGGLRDHVTPPEQATAVAAFRGTPAPPDVILADSSHLGLFMGAPVLADVWAGAAARWLRAH